MGYTIAALIVLALVVVWWFRRRPQRVRMNVNYTMMPNDFDIPGLGATIENLTFRGVVCGRTPTGGVKVRWDRVLLDDKVIFDRATANPASVPVWLGGCGVPPTNPNAKWAVTFPKIGPESGLLPEISIPELIKD